MPECQPGRLRADKRRRCHPGGDGHPRSDSRCTCHSPRRRTALRRATHAEESILNRRAELPGESRQAATEIDTMQATQDARDDNSMAPEVWVDTQARCTSTEEIGTAALRAQERNRDGPGSGVLRSTNWRAHGGHRSDRTAGPPSSTARCDAPSQRKRQISRSRRRPVGQKGTAKQARLTADSYAREGGRQHQQMQASTAGGIVRDSSPREPQPRLQGRGWHERWPPPALGGGGRQATAAL